MNVEVKNGKGIIWAHGYVDGERCGIASSNYRLDGTQESVIAALELALEQARFEASITTAE